MILYLLWLAAMVLAYSNHFQNGFHFDDSHTIVNNKAIHEINILQFFKDASTFSTLITNQSYRPLTTLENAIDYNVGGGLVPKAFHWHIFITFLLTCTVLCYVVKIILDKLVNSNYNKYWGLLVAAISGLLCANAETVNYIIQRAEIVSGLFVLLGFLFYLRGGILRKWHLYLIFPLIGFFSKEMAFVFAPLLLLYLLIFEEDVDLLHFYRRDEIKKCLRSFMKAGPAILLTAVFFIFYSKMLPETFEPGGVDVFQYLITQPMVMLHYIATFFIPYNLSADTDWTVFESLADYRAILGIFGILVLAYLALKASKKKETKLFSFGMLWFFIALLPTSSFIPFAEVLNDHRSFIPYMGLTMAFVFGVKYLLDTYLSHFIAQKRTKVALLVLGALFLAGNAYGVYNRNKVWKDELSLWKDVTLKSPKNGRGFMNYGLALMASGDLDNAEINYNKALDLRPNYSYIYTNLAILQAAKGDKVTAENNFKKAISFQQHAYTHMYYYGRFLLGEGRYDEAIDAFTQVMEVASNYSNTEQLLMTAYHNIKAWDRLETLADAILKTSPKDATAIKYKNIAEQRISVTSMLEQDLAASPTPEKYLDLSLRYFNEGNYEACIRAASQAVALKADYPAAYNNIGIANFYLKKFDASIEAYQKALQLDPGYDLAKNNLTNAVNAKQWEASEASITKNLSANDLIDLSLKYYNEANYIACISVAEKSISMLPTANAYNNICTAYNQLKEYDKAIAACEEALKLDADHTLAQGNLQFALQKKSNQ